MIEALAILLTLTPSDQQKLEALIRKIPEAFVKTEEALPFSKKFYSFPRSDREGFRINCEARHYRGSSVPSLSQCQIILYSESNRGRDEHLLELKDQEISGQLFRAISYGDEVEKRWFSNERVYGMSLKDRYEDHFRLSISCRSQSCRLTYSTKDP